MGKVISVRKVEKSFGKTVALKDLSFDVGDGEIFGFLGPSGAGKTTTIKLLTHQLIQDKGDIDIFSHSVSEMSRDDDDRVIIKLDDGTTLEATRAVKDIGKKLGEIKAYRIGTIHSREPNLEDIFLKVTGRTLS